MWTPLLLLCYLDRADCAIFSAPAYYSEQSCLSALDFAMSEYVVPEDMFIAGYHCYNWGTRS